MNKNKRGFTLAETIIVLVILTILIAIAVPAIFKYIEDANDAKILAQAKPVLTTSKAEAVKLYANGKLDTLPSDEKLHRKIMEISECEGSLIKIALNTNKTSSGDFVIKIQNKYLYYNDQKQIFTFITKEEIDNNIFDNVNTALNNEEVKQLILDYYQRNTNTYKLDSEGPNYGSEIKSRLKSLGISPDDYSFRIWSKGNSNSITIGSPKITLDMVSKQVVVTRYDYGNSKDFTSTPTIYSASVTISKDSTIDKKGNIVEFATYKLDDANWVIKK